MSKPSRPGHFVALKIAPQPTDEQLLGHVFALKLYDLMLSRAINEDGTGCKAALDIMKHADQAVDQVALAAEERGLNSSLIRGFRMAQLGIASREDWIAGHRELERLETKLKAEQRRKQHAPAPAAPQLQPPLPNLGPEILLALARRNETLTQEQLLTPVETLINKATSTKTIGRRLNDLIDLGLVKHEGRKGGYKLTDAGLSRAADLSQS